MKIIRARVADHFIRLLRDEQDAERKSTPVLRPFNESVL